MNQEENLNAYKDAYEVQFKFYDENQWYLAQYASLMSDTILKESLKSVLSLGIGHQVVSNQLLSLLKENVISNYEIVEGSASIISNFLNANQNISIGVHESFFENFDSVKKFDAIEMGFVLEHVDDPLLILKRFKSFLNPGGTIFVSVPNARSLHRLIGHKAGLLNNMYSLSNHDLELGHKRYFDLDTISSNIEDAGYRIVKSKGLMLKPITGDQINQLKWDNNIISALMEIGLDYPEIANCMYLEAKI
jgi:SAM-dependent methyltransferase